MSNPITVPVLYSLKSTSSDSSAQSLSAAPIYSTPRKSQSPTNSSQIAYLVPVHLISDPVDSKITESQPILVPAPPQQHYKGQNSFQDENEYVYIDSYM